MKTITIRNEEISIRELPWRDALAIARRLAESILGALDSEGKLVLDAAKLNAVLTENEELVSDLLAKCTGREREWVDALPARDAIRLLSASVEKNLDSEMIAAARDLASRVVSGLFVRVDDKK